MIKLKIGMSLVAMAVTIYALSVWSYIGTTSAGDIAALQFNPSDLSYVASSLGMKLFGVGGFIVAFAILGLFLWAVWKRDLKRLFQ